MNFNNYTIKAQEAVQKATEIAGGNQQQAIETGHLLKGLFPSKSQQKLFCTSFARPLVELPNPKHLLKT